MLYSKEDQERPWLKDTLARELLEKCEHMPKYKLGEESINPDLAYKIVMDELMNESKSRQNLATFCQTFMEPQAEKLMGATMDKNAIDKSEYPRTAELENRCVNIIADLWNSDDNSGYMGTSTIGSSEACMLGGMAMKFRWRKQAEKLGMDTTKKPNIVISSGYQVCWEKFCVYWDIEMRTVPMTKDNLKLDLDKVLNYVDEYTIGVVGILGGTYTGKYDDIEGLNDILNKYNKGAKIPVYIHVDAASGGFYTPFVQPNLKWDFRLNNVISINSSGHKYGLVYLGIGWIVWKNQEYLPKELIFKVSYLGGSIPTIAINFSHSASQLIGQYYNFLRFGRNGYEAIQNNTRKVSMFLAEMVQDTGLFEILNDGTEMPIVCYRFKDDNKKKWSLYDLSDRLQMHGWQIPTYPLPEDVDDVVIQRLVCRAGFSMNMAEEFADNFTDAIKELDNAEVLRKAEDDRGVQGFTH